MNYNPYLRFVLSFILFFVLTSQIFAQDIKGDKEVIIIEKTVDANGNIISKNTRRFNGKYSEDQIQKFIDEDPLPPTRSYDLEGLGFGEDFGDLFRSDTKRPTIGVNLNFDNGQARVEKVSKGSGAELADIRIGDRLLSINGVAISSIDDIYEILETKAIGNKVRMILFRDGEELEKEVELGLNSGSSLFFEFPERGSFKLFGGDGEQLKLNIDSLLRGLSSQGELFEGLQFDNFGQLDNKEEADEKESEERPTLGVFIDDSRARVLVTEIIKDSPAGKSGLRANDVILRMDDNVVTSFREVSAYMNTKKKGDSVSLEIERSGKILNFKVDLY